MKEVIKIDDNNIKQRMAIFKRFMTEINLWPRWKRYIAKTERANHWITGRSITNVTRSVDFSKELVADYYNPIGLGYFYFTEVLGVFLRLFTDYERRAAIYQEEYFNLTLNFYLQYRKSYNPRDHYQVYNEETLKALYFLDKIGVLDKWIKESPNIRNRKIKLETDEDRHRHPNGVCTQITQDIFL